MKTKKFVGYVPKGETISQTLEQFQDYPQTVGMYKTKKDAYNDLNAKIVKRTITLSWEDEPVKEKK